MIAIFTAQNWAFLAKLRPGVSLGLYRGIIVDHRILNSMLKKGINVSHSRPIIKYDLLFYFGRVENR